MHSISTIIFALAAGLTVPSERVEDAAQGDCEGDARDPAGKRPRCKAVAERRAKNRAARAARRKGRR